MKISEVIDNGLCCTASACSCLYDSYLLLVVVSVNTLVCCLEITTNGHSVVGFEYFAGSQPRVGRILLR